MLRLSTFTISHFSEKARWALDLEGVGFTDRRLLPGPHILTIKRRSPKTTVPVLEHDRVVVQGSSAILDYLERDLGKTKLVPREQDRERAAALEARADKAFGLGTQRIFYATLLEHPSEVVRMWSQAGPFWGRALLTLAFPLLAKGVRRAYKIEPTKIEEAKDLFRRTFEETDALLSNSPFLFGDRMCRVDVTVAALLAPLCRPPEHELVWPIETPPPLDAYLREFQGRPTFDYVLRMYRDHRRSRLQ